MNPCVLDGTNRNAIWVICSSLLYLVVVGERDSFIFPSKFGRAEEVPISQVYAGVMSPPLPAPGVGDSRVVHHQDLNKRILIALIVASTLLGGLLLFLCCFCLYRVRRSKESDMISPPQSGHSLAPILGRFDSLRAGMKRRNVSVFEYRMLEAATDNFHESNKLKDRGSACVYIACFPDNSNVLVKKLDACCADALKQFDNEVGRLREIKHQNIITFLGYCIHGDARFLVYEMMHNGSLESQLHEPSHDSALTWPIRMKIALDVARALEYLHERCNPPMIHRDVKSSNILLDSSFNAKLSDFGLAVTGGMQNKNDIKLSAASGYAAPEYLSDDKLTDKIDVYGFGVVLLELLTGRKPMEKLPSDQCQSIVTWAMPKLTDRIRLPGIVDPAIRNQMDLKHLYQVAAVAVLCVQPEPSYRPLITDILHSFIPLVPMELGGSLRVS